MDLKPSGNTGGLEDLKNKIISDNLSASQKPKEATLDDIVEENHQTFSMSDVEVSEPTPSTPSASPASSKKSKKPEEPAKPAKLVDLPSGMNLDSIEIEEVHKKEDGFASFSFDDDSTEKKEENTLDKIKNILSNNFSGRSLTTYVAAIVLFVLLLLGAGGFYIAERYVYYSTQPAESLTDYQKSTLKKMKEYRSYLEGMGIFSKSTLTAPQKATPSDNLHATVSSTKTSYVEKYDYIKAYLKLLDKTIPNRSHKLHALKEELASYPFFPRDIQGIINIDNDYSLQRSLLSLEGVKFRTALAVFSKFDSFIDDFALESGKTHDEIVAFLDKILKRGDRDIDTYLKTCYMNPYEIPKLCTQYKDFARTYKMRELATGTGADMNTALFASMMGFMDTKLEASVLPSLSLSASNFDPQKQTLTLDLGVNTLPEDTLQLYKQGILNPHIYVVSNMINFLRQSKFIISKDIAINELAIETVMVPVGSKEIPVSTSRFSFDLPLQKATEREITDFYYEKIKTQRPASTDDITNTGTGSITETETGAIQNIATGTVAEMATGSLTETMTGTTIENATGSTKNTLTGDMQKNTLTGEKQSTTTGANPAFDEKRNF